MSRLEPAVTTEQLTHTYLYSSHIHTKRRHKHVLKAKENSLKYKYDKALRKKLKKYKLRHDGKEDQDILDVSKTLVTVLKIKSPNFKSQENGCPSSSCLVDENYYPKNYLVKMGRRKQINKTNEPIDSNGSLPNTHFDRDIHISPVWSNKEKQHMNAFKVMMDSRNKSIGSNSPGKEKSVEELDTQDIVDKKAVKAKRNLILQKMAEAKGSLKKKELEDYKEQCITKKMEKRAERLKDMIVNNNKSKVEKSDKEIDCNVKITSDELKNDCSNKKQQKTLTLVNLFNDATKFRNNKSPEKSYVRKEDEEFFKKLSPSIKKKENMLCYFRKVDKESSSIDDENENCNVIKVKLSSKSKKNGRKKKLSLNKTEYDAKQELQEKSPCSKLLKIEASLEAEEDFIINDRRKRKRKNNNISDNVESKDDKEIITESPIRENTRPKRVVKKPIKYEDDLQLFSSDEEYHIFTPKKKKHSDRPPKPKVSSNKDDNKDLIVKSKQSKESHTVPVPAKIVKEHNIPKKATKLAPIFAAKPQVDPAVIEAKQKFLHSGVPDKLKRVITEQKSKCGTYLSVFPVVVHVQQNIQSEEQTSTRIAESVLQDDDISHNLYMIHENNLFSKMLHLDEANNHIESTKYCFYNRDILAVLNNIKKMYTKFPVFRTYSSLKNKSSGEFKDYSYTDLDNSIEVINGMVDINNPNPDKLNWTDKYKPMSTKQIIGNFETIKELRKWLVTWTENEAKSKRKGSIESDSSDFYQSDTDSKDSIKTSNNLLVIKGPVGSGKTSSVYAVAAELAIKVIEVNASGKRTGKIMLQDLQEATQSHKVNRGKSSTENSQKSQEIVEGSKKRMKKKGRPKKTVAGNSSKKTLNNEHLKQSQPSSSQDTVRTGMSLILIDDADIVFEQDDGFCSAIVQLVQCSKRPVILITSSGSCPHLQRFLQSAKIISMQPLLPRILGTWLDIMCLADNGICLPGLGAKYLDLFQGDIRKTINSLQFYISSQLSQESTNNKECNLDNNECLLNVDDENSSMSWVDHEIPEAKHASLSKSEEKDMKQFFNEELNLLRYRHPLDLFKIWWTIPTFLNFSFIYDKGNGQKNIVDSSKSHGISELEVIAKAIDAISLSDHFRHINPDTSIDITSQPWYSNECDSVSESENMYNYNSSHEIIDEISHRLVSGSIIEAQKVLELERNIDVDFPSMTEQR